MKGYSEYKGAKVALIISNFYYDYLIHLIRNTKQQLIL